MMQHAGDRNGDDGVTRRTNFGTALVLASIAVVLFGGVIYAQYSGDADSGIAVTGFAIIGFLALAIARRKRRGA